jgi:hypothetical protein
MKSRNRHAEYYTNLDGKYPPVESPYGKVYTVTNACAFAREHGLDDGALNKVLRSKAYSHKGWRLYKENNNE